MPSSDNRQSTASDRSTLLVVDDDAEIVELLTRYLGRHGFDVIAAGSAAQSRSVVESRRVDLVLLDLGLPDEDGLSLLRHLQGTWRGPVIVVTGRGEAVDRVVGLELGADDYVAKPFDFRELLARVRSVLRRAQPAADAPAPDPGKGLALSFSRYRLNLATRQLHDSEGRDIPLTTGEFELLQVLVQHPQQVLSRDRLMNDLHGRDAGPYDRAIDVQIARLRRKIETNPAVPQLIKSVRGAGYLFSADVRRS